jgi:hypothetical protein
MYNVIIEDLKYLSDHNYKYVTFSFEKLTGFLSSGEFLISDFFTPIKIEKFLSENLKNNTKLSLRVATENQDKYNSEFDYWYEIYYYFNKNNKLMKDIRFNYNYKDYFLYNFDNYSYIIKDQVYLFNDDDSYSIEELIKIIDNLVFL